MGWITTISTGSDRELITLCLLAPSAGNFCKQFGPRSGRQDVGPDLDPNCLSPLIVFAKEFSENINFEKYQQTTKENEKLPSMPSAGNFCKQFGPRSGRQDVGPDLNPNSLTL